MCSQHLQRVNLDRSLAKKKKKKKPPSLTKFWKSSGRETTLFFYAALEGFIRNCYNYSHDKVIDFNGSQSNISNMYHATLVLGIVFKTLTSVEINKSSGKPNKE